MGRVREACQVRSLRVKAPAAAVGRSELAQDSSPSAQHPPIRLSGQEIADIVRFLGALPGPIVEAPAP